MSQQFNSQPGIINANITISPITMSKPNSVCPAFLPLFSNFSYPIFPLIYPNINPNPQAVLFSSYTALPNYANEIKEVMAENKLIYSQNLKYSVNVSSPSHNIYKMGKYSNYNLVNIENLNTLSSEHNKLHYLSHKNDDIIYDSTEDEVCAITGGRDLNNNLFKECGDFEDDIPQLLCKKDSLSKPNNNNNQDKLIPQKKKPNIGLVFKKGSCIQLQNGEKKLVEDLKTKDFIKSSKTSPDFDIVSASVVSIKAYIDIDKDNDKMAKIDFFLQGICKNNSLKMIEMIVQACHLFFVPNLNDNEGGWASVNPDTSFEKYGLTSCRQLTPGDDCLILLAKKRNLIDQVSNPENVTSFIIQSSGQEHISAANNFATSQNRCFKESDNNHPISLPIIPSS